jgi:hypothetical protein
MSKVCVGYLIPPDKFYNNTLQQNTINSFKIPQKYISPYQLIWYYVTKTADAAILNKAQIL